MRWPIQMAEGGADEGGSSGGTPPPSPEGGAPEQTMLSGENMSLLDWRQGFAEELRTSPILQRFPSSEHAARALVEQDHMLGRALFLPDRRKAPTGSDEYLTGIQKVQAKLREYDPDLAPPEKPEEYEWEVPDDREMNADASTFWQTVFHKAGVTKGAAKDIMAAFWQAAEQAERQQAGRAQESYQEGRNALYREFGVNTQNEIKLFENFVRFFGGGAFSGDAGEKFLEQLQRAIDPEDGSRLANSPYMVATFANAWRKLGEGELHESTEYRMGESALEAMQARYRELQTKRFDGTLTTDEAQEHARLAGRLADQRERANGTYRNQGVLLGL